MKRLITRANRAYKSNGQTWEVEWNGQTFPASSKVVIYFSNELNTNIYNGIIGELVYNGDSSYDDIMVMEMGQPSATGISLNSIYSMCLLSDYSSWFSFSDKRFHIGDRIVATLNNGDAIDGELVGIHLPSVQTIEIKDMANKSHIVNIQDIQKTENKDWF